MKLTSHHLVVKLRMHGVVRPSPIHFLITINGVFLCVSDIETACLSDTHRLSFGHTPPVFRTQTACTL